MDSMKILIRAPNWVGDSVLSLPAMNTIKRNFPESEIWVAANDWVRDLFSTGEVFSGTISLPRKQGFKSLRDSARSIRDFRFDLGVLFTNSFASALGLYMARIPQRWGYKKDGRSLLLTKGVPVQSQNNRAHQVYYYLDLLSGLGLKEFPQEFSLAVDQQEKSRTEAPNGGPLKIMQNLSLSSRKGPTRRS
jgi:heptosyltransferase-2